MTEEPPAHLIDWKGNDWTPESGDAVQPPERPVHGAGRAVPVHRGQLGGPGRRADLGDPVRRPPRHQRAAGERGARLEPRRVHRRDRVHGADGGGGRRLGELRRDPFAMLPFCGYNMADYWGHWLKIGERADPEKLPKIYQVNWFRKDADGNFIWPGFGDNSRVLAWIIERVEGEVEAEETAIGRRPGQGGDLDLDRPRPHRGADGGAVRGRRLTRWLAECDLTEEYFAAVRRPGAGRALGRAERAARAAAGGQGLIRASRTSPEGAALAAPSAIPGITGGFDRPSTAGRLLGNG